MNMKDNTPLVGILSIEEVYRDTGEIIDSYIQQNMITTEGYASILKNIAQFDTGMSTDNVISTIVLGDDVGSGTPSDPEPPTILSTYLDQSDVVNIPPADITITYPSVGEFVVSSILNGQQLVDAVSGETIPYTSASLRFASGESLSYKRFPVKIISRLIDVRINWSIKFN